MRLRLFDYFPWVGGRLAGPIAERRAEAVHGNRLAGRVRPNRRIIALHPTKYGGQRHVGKHPAPGCRENLFAFCNPRQTPEQVDCRIGQRDMVLLASFHAPSTRRLRAVKRRKISPSTVRNYLTTTVSPMGCFAPTAGRRVAGTDR